MLFVLFVALWLLPAGLFSLIFLLLCFFDPIQHCDHLVGEEGIGCFAFLGFVACVKSVVVCLLFLLENWEAIFCDWGIFYINCAFVYFGCSVLLKTNVLKRVPMRTVIFGILVELHLSKRATITFEQARDKTYSKTFVTSKDSDLPAHPTSMTRVQVPFLITRGL